MVALSVLVALTSIPSAAAVSVDYGQVTGLLSTGSATFDGASTMHLERGAYQAGNGTGASLEISGSFERAELHFVRLDCKGAGGVDASGGSQYSHCSGRDEGQRAISNGTFAFRSGAAGNVMVDAETGGFRAQSNASSLRIGPSQDSSWLAGLQATRASGPGSSSEAGLSHEVEIPVGAPVAAGDGPSIVSWSDNGSIFVWGGTLDITSSDGRTESFKSGVWWSNATGSAVQPEGVARDEHRQFVSVHLVGAHAEVAVESGAWRSTAEQLRAESTGTVLLYQAAGSLEGDAGRITVQGAETRLTGTIQASIRPGPDPSLLAAELRGEHVTVSSSAATFQGPQESVSAGVVPWLLPLLVVALPVVLLVGWWLRIKRRPAGSVAVAEELLLQGEYGRALAEAERAVKQDSADTDALFCMGTALFKLGRHHEIVTRLEPVMQAGTGSAVLAFVLGLACAAMRRDEAAVHWALEAAKDPDIRPTILTVDALAAVRRMEPFQRWARRHVDPAYG